MLLYVIWHKISSHLQQKHITKLLAIDQLYTATLHTLETCFLLSTFHIFSPSCMPNSLLKLSLYIQKVITKTLLKSIWKTDRCKGEIYMRLKANLFALKHIKANDFLNLQQDFLIFIFLQFCNFISTISSQITNNQFT